MKQRHTGMNSTTLQTQGTRQRYAIRFHLTISRTFHILFKFLFIFPSRYLFAIGLLVIFSFRRILPPNLCCSPKQHDSHQSYLKYTQSQQTGLKPSVTLYLARSSRDDGTDKQGVDHNSCPRGEGLKA